MSFEMEDIPGMAKTGWKQRLADGIRNKGMSERAVSLAAGKGPGYVHSILKEGKDPTIDNLADVCKAADLSLIWVLFGVEMSRETEEIVQALQDASPARRRGLLEFLRDEADETDQGPRALPSPSSTASDQ